MTNATTSNVFRTKTRLFDRWAPSYDWLFPSVFYQAVHQRLLEFVELPEQPQVLDVGCGTGRLLNRLVKQYPDLRGTGLDLSPEMLAQARQKAIDCDRIQFVPGTSHAMPFGDDQFDAAFCSISFLHYPDPVVVLGELKRVLKPQGRFYLADYSPSKLFGGHQHFNISTTGGIYTHGPEERVALGQQAGLTFVDHHYLLGPILLTVWSA